MREFIFSNHMYMHVFVFECKFSGIAALKYLINRKLFYIFIYNFPHTYGYNVFY